MRQRGAAAAAVEGGQWPTRSLVAARDLPRSVLHGWHARPPWLNTVPRPVRCCCCFCLCACLCRIFRTPIPLVYTRHTSRFLLVWLTILPFGTAGQVGWLSVPIACAMAFFLLGIEEIGVQVSEWRCCRWSQSTHRAAG